MCVVFRAGTGIEKRVRVGYLGNFRYGYPRVRVLIENCVVAYELSNDEIDQQKLQ